MPYILGRGPSDQPATARAIKQCARDIIEARYPLWKQLNILMDGGAALAEMKAWIAAVRDRSNAIEAEITADPSVRRLSKKHWLDADGNPVAAQQKTDRGRDDG